MARRTYDPELDELSRKVTALQAQVQRMQHVQAASLRRIHLLPGNLQRLLQVENLTQGSLTADGQGMMFELGGQIGLTIFPFADFFRLEDQSGVMSPLEIAFGEQADFDQDTILAIVGFAELAKRGELSQSAETWASALNGSLAAA